jgi:hypothetical protein
MLARQLFTLTTYLIVKDLSAWEHDWRQLEEYQLKERHRVPTYNNFQTVIFATLGVASAFWPTVVHFVYCSGSPPLRLAYSFLSAVLSILVGAIAEIRLRDARQQALDRWGKAGIGAHPQGDVPAQQRCPTE